MWSYVFFDDTATTESYTYCHTLSLHDALPIYRNFIDQNNRADAAYPQGGITEYFNRNEVTIYGGEATAHYKFDSGAHRSEEHTSELQSLMRISYAVFCLKKKKQPNTTPQQISKQVQDHIYDSNTDSLTT